MTRPLDFLHEGKIKMEMEMQKTVSVQAKTLKMYLKVSDRFTAELTDQDGETIHTQEDGYVPSFMPGKHYGDYVYIDIDIDSGMVVNWTKPNKEDLQQWINNEDEI